jgi:indolepyruvate decarboxylase
MMQTDIDTGIFTSRIPQIPHATFTQDRLCAATAVLSEVAFSKLFTSVAPQLREEKRTASQSPITAQAVFDILQSCVTEEMLFVADVGDCLFGASDLKLPENSFVSNAYFSALGFAVPGAIGAALAKPEKRVIALVGDGAFQMTGTELATAHRFQLNPIVILFNNKGYGTERPILDGKYNDIANWNYALLPELFGSGKGSLVKTEEEFEQAFKSAMKDASQYHLIEVDLDPLDFSNAAKRFGTVVQEAFQNRESHPIQEHGQVLGKSP